MDLLVRLFRRETSSGEFIPIVDGLRFLAILMVVLFHANAYLAVKSEALTFDRPPDLLASLPNPFVVMGQGVQLFFVISGFILAIPFMRYYFGLSERKPVLKAYFLRRLTRLEPPYILSTVLVFLIVIFMVGDQRTLGTWLTSLGASLLYIHLLVFPGEFPYINDVSWSLEIEVQYYILAPLIMWGICRIKRTLIRRVVTLSLIAGFACVSWLTEVYFKINVVFITSFLHYFISGILLCDVFLLDSDKLEKLGRPLFFILGVVLLGAIACIDHAYSASILLRLLSPFMILAFYLIVFGNRWWRSILSLNGITLIGGMCYSIYLLHYVVIPAVGRLTLTGLHISDYFIFSLVQGSIFIIAVLFVSAVFYLLIEKPCMSRDWHLKLYEKVRNIAWPREKVELKNTV